jgi:subtilisin family serine protease
VEGTEVRDGVLRAPGREVVTLVPGGSYDFLSGSSLATAHVTGAVALMVARSRKLERATAYDLLFRSEGPAKDRPDGAPINICLALADLMRRPTCPAIQSADLH